MCKAKDVTKSKHYVSCVAAAGSLWGACATYSILWFGGTFNDPGVISQIKSIRPSNRPVDMQVEHGQSYIISLYGWNDGATETWHPTKTHPKTAKEFNLRIKELNAKIKELEGGNSES